MEIRPVSSSEIHFPTNKKVTKKEDMIEEPKKSELELPRWTNTAIILIPKSEVEVKDNDK